MKIIYDRNNSVSDETVLKVVFYISSKGKHLLSRFSNTLYLDGTYSLSNKGYANFPFFIANEHCHTQIIAWALTSNETKENLVACIKEFVDSVGQEHALKIENIIVDKNFTEIQALYDVLPGSFFVLCRFHVVQTLFKKNQRHLSAN